jgi:hypothetical protein
MNILPRNPKLRGGVVLYVAGWKQHYYPAGERLVVAFKDQLASYSVSKGTIRFPFSEPVPANIDRTYRKVPRRRDRPAREVEMSRLEKALGRALTACETVCQRAVLMPDL